MDVKQFSKFKAISYLKSTSYERKLIHQKTIDKTLDTAITKMMKSTFKPFEFQYLRIVTID